MAGLPPSGHRNVRQNLFGFKPIDQTAEEELFRQFEKEKVREVPPCFICKRDFEAGSTFDHTVMILHCTHKFHLKCIFRYWDDPNRYLHSCPTCGISPFLVHELVGISPGANNPIYDSNDPSFTFKGVIVGPVLSAAALAIPS